MERLDIFEKKYFEEKYIPDYIALFVKCFSKSEEMAWRAFNKFKESDRYVVAIAFLDEKPAAMYSVILFDYCGEVCGLSVDTMSDGSVSAATKKLGSSLYEYLSSRYNCSVICGFPNRNVIAIRKRYLKWVIDPVPMEISFCFLNLPSLSTSSAGLFDMNIFERGASRAVSNTMFGLKLAGSSIFLEKKFLCCFFYASNRKRFLFSVRLPKKYFKIFGYRVLNEDSRAASVFRSGAYHLTFDSIDVP
jgi:hypothetical protein